ncbi:MAG: DUF2889 domain-containing protein [Dehalococcoidia bacterium]|nr:MAG: DUF2889 domain-containing protein [Dehalococcoidia bacterium]
MSALSFSRSKLVAVENKDANTLKAHGFLEDYIYCMEIDVEVDITSFKVTAISGRMNRITTSECHKAIAVLQNAVGLDITEKDFARTVNRIIGRAGCLHFGSLLTECCDSIMQAIIFSDLEKDGFKYMEVNKSYAKDKADTLPGLKNSCIAYTGL